MDLETTTGRPLHKTSDLVEAAFLIVKGKGRLRMMEKVSPKRVMAFIEVDGAEDLMSAYISGEMVPAKELIDTYDALKSKAMRLVTDSD